MKKKFRKILVANRGEIAVRVMRTCRRLGISTVAVYSGPDAHAPFVHYADESFPLEGQNVTETYLDGERILRIAREAGADAIHPGYGFLSEDEGFASLVEKSEVRFIGPASDVIRMLGDKVEARKLAVSAGIPVVPGGGDALESAVEARALCSRLGYPVLLKAVGGGGGKGMRRVDTPEELESAFRAASGEAAAAFGDGRVYVEKLIEAPRHVELQILADSRGNIIHLGERECTIQRRHQKIIEESPSAFVTDSLRKRMSEAALAIMKAAGYTNAGTVEFLVDAKGDFYFLEVNTRLQVEHPVTEMRTGLDLVAEQIRIAEGMPLPLRQEQVRFIGHAVECRIYAEDPYENFFPSTGEIVRLTLPEGPFVRNDAGIREGDVVSPLYDPLLAKLITWGPTRNEALDSMSRALGEYELFGIRHNIPLCLWVINESHFRDGKFDTGFLADRFTPALLSVIPDDVFLSAAIAVAASGQGPGPGHNGSADAERKSLWWSQNLDSMR